LFLLQPATVRAALHQIQRHKIGRYRGGGGLGRVPCTGRRVPSGQGPRKGMCCTDRCRRRCRARTVRTGAGPCHDTVQRRHLKGRSKGPWWSWICRRFLL